MVNIAIFKKNDSIGHIWPYLYAQNYGHDWYPWKDNEKTKLPVKKLSDLDVWVKSYDQKMDFNFLEKILIFSKIKNGSKIHFLVTKSKFWDHFYFFNFKSWRNKSGVRIVILWIKSGFLATFFGILSFFILLYQKEITFTTKHQL